MDVGGLLGNEAIRARLDAAAAQDRFSHSYLICGPDGSGKHTLAKILAAAMQCTGAGRKPCGRCEGCRKVFEGVHPDVITVNDPAHKTIAVDVIRQMRADVFLRPNEGKRKIYLIEQDMAEPPQNALLKILEEPPAYAAFLILSDRAEKLLPTIRSRCAELHLAPAPQTEGLAFLRGKYPDRAEPELERAFRRAGGYLGQAIQLLSGEGQAPQTAQFAACYAARNALALLELLLPKLMSNIVDVGIAGGDRAYILATGTKMVLMALCSLALGIGAAALSSRAGMGFGANLRLAEYTQVQKFSFSNIEHFSTASLITRLTNDVSSVQMMQPRAL